ncbi:hypothetical protein AB0B27_31095 [Micromonospora rifamycinica]|uniref:hypothetical protein n=1 Tax=Micromonospora rifamycinica TaxID=291594 RepID=UPI0033C540C1
MITTVPHPDWCEPELCDAEVPTLPAEGGVHRSAPQRLVVTRPLGDAMLIVTQLQRPGSIWLSDSTRKRMTLAQAVEQSTNVAVQVDGGPLTLLPLPQARWLAEQLAPLLGVTVTVAG